MSYASLRQTHSREWICFSREHETSVCCATWKQRSPCCLMMEAHDMVLDCPMEEDIEIFRLRDEKGCFNELILRHLIDNETKFKEYFRVSTEIFDTILSFITEDITKSQYNRVKRPISPEQKLCLTLRRKLSFLDIPVQDLFELCECCYKRDSTFSIFENILATVGSYGKEDDAGIIIKSALGKLVSYGTLNFPDPVALPGRDTVMANVTRNSVKMTKKRRYIIIDTVELDVRGRMPLVSFANILECCYRYCNKSRHSGSSGDRSVHNTQHYKNSKIICPIEEDDQDGFLPTEHMLPMARQGRNATYNAYNIRDKFQDTFAAKRVKSAGK
ncbi:hypothetical protein PR048_027392 [Dryococelus australis]|uniref:Uncharacterized protein n=1 Tax=Dryococelus australis TaxID=614101 RepID=A0ABQ9GFC6_9NEOP|nr:hypothetical protein PR048_027392 [Dryococelus australis]